MCACPRVPDKASLLSRPSTTIHRIDIGSAQRYPQPRRSSRASCGVGEATDHGEPQASVRATGIVVNGSRTQNRGVAIHHRYKRVTALRMRGWRWYGGLSSTHIRHTDLQVESAKRTRIPLRARLLEAADMDGPAWAWRGILARASATNATVAQRCPIMERRETVCGQSLGGPTLSVSRVVVGRAARDSCTSRQLMPHHERASAGRAAARHVRALRRRQRGQHDMARLHACRWQRYRDGVSLARVWLQEVPGGRGIRLGGQTPEERESAPRLCSATRVNGRDGQCHHDQLLFSRLCRQPSAQLTDSLNNACRAVTIRADSSRASRTAARPRTSRRLVA